MRKLCFTLFLLMFFATSAFAAVNINTANVQELTSLPGIGKAKAEAIVQYRQANGPFKSVDDITKVKGIGPKKLEKIRKEITVGK